MDCIKAPFPFWKLDQTFQVIQANPAAIHLSENPFRGLSTEDQERLKKLARTNNENNLCLKWEFQEKTKWLNWRIWIDQGHFIFTASDITSLKENELYLHQIMDAIPDMILVKGEGSRILWANKAFKDHYGMTQEALKEIVDAPFQNPDYTRQYVLDDAWVWNNKKSLLIESEPVTRHDGVVRQFETLKSPILDQNGITKMTVGVSRDITEKLEYEQKSFASSKMASLGEMAGGIAHEINNPIGIITAKISQMRRGSTEQKILNDLDVIHRNAERIAKIVEGLRNFCQNDERQFYSRFNVREVLEETLTYCLGRITNIGTELILELDSSLMMTGKRIQISQILLNLLNNAIDALEGRDQRWIRITGHETNGFVEVRVHDSGPGIPSEIETKIMQPFFTTKEIGKGIGLGLSVSFAIAKQHGGELKLDRKISSSCFLLKIPV